MRPFFATLGLLLCLIATRADELRVIKDSEAVQYVGRYVEVRGLVESVTMSPLGTVFINFGGEYPNQTFAGFIAAGSKMVTDQLIAMLPLFLNMAWPSFSDRTTDPFPFSSQEAIDSII